MEGLTGLRSCYHAGFSTVQGHKGEIRPPGETLRLLSWCVKRTHLISQHQRVTARVKSCLLRKRIGDSVPRGCTKNWLQRHRLPSANRNPRLPEGEQVCATNRTARFQHSPLSLLGMGGSLPTSKFPDASRGPAQQADLSNNSSPTPAVSTFPAS